MPAGSERDLPPLPRTWRPLGTRVMSIGLAVMLFAMGTATWLIFDDETRALWTLFQKGTVIVLYLFIVVLVWCLARCRVSASADGVVVVNGFRRHEYEWAELVGVTMGPGAPWATVDLADGDTVQLIAIQATDGIRARQAVLDLRAYAAQQSGWGS